VPFFREQSALFLREKCLKIAFFAQRALLKTLISVISRKCFSFPGKYHISGKFFCISGNFFLYVRKNVVYPENVLGMSGKFLWDNLLPPVANFSGKKFLDALFYSKSAPQSLAPPTFRSFLRP
jgi:hypothetical protein